MKFCRAQIPFKTWFHQKKCVACQIVLLQESASGDVSSSVAKTVRFEDQALQDRLEAEKSREGKLQRDLQTFKVGLCLRVSL